MYLLWIKFEYIYNIPHGTAVFWGMILVFKVFGNEKNLNDIIALKTGLNLKTHTSPWFNKEFPIDKIMTYLSKDKKVSTTHSIDLILIDDIGNPRIETKTFEEILSALEANKDELRKFSF